MSCRYSRTAHITLLRLSWAKPQLHIAICNTISFLHRKQGLRNQPEYPAFCFPSRKYRHSGHPCKIPASHNNPSVKPTACQAQHKARPPAAPTGEPKKSTFPLPQMLPPQKNPVPPDKFQRNGILSFYSCFTLRLPGIGYATGRAGILLMRYCKITITSVVFRMLSL